MVSSRYGGGAVFISAVVIRSKSMTPLAPSMTLTAFFSYSPRMQACTGNVLRISSLFVVVIGPAITMRHCGSTW